MKTKTKPTKKPAKKPTKKPRVSALAPRERLEHRVRVALYEATRRQQDNTQVIANIARLWLDDRNDQKAPARDGNPFRDSTWICHKCAREFSARAPTRIIDCTWKEAGVHRQYVYAVNGSVQHLLHDAAACIGSGKP
jgi:hypothetical protein